MGPPLSIINEFIYMNVIRYFYEDEDQVSEATYWKDRVIPLEKLRFFLEALIPKNLNKQKRDTWAERINGILNNYEMYTRKVCGTTHVAGEGIKFKDHKKMWDGFHSKFPGYKSEINYSVHY